MTGPAPADASGEPRRVPTLWQQNVVHGDGHLFAVQNGDLFVYFKDNGEPAFRVAPFPLTPPVVPFASEQLLSHLLATRYEVVDFAGRDGELRDLTAWRDDSVSDVGVMLIHGPGGQGKSRLAAEFGRACAAAGWEVRAARHRIDVPVSVPVETVVVGGQDCRAGSGNVGLLLVVDYADRWPYPDLVALLEDQATQYPTGKPVRVLLLARSAGMWWETLAHQFERVGLGAQEYALHPAAADAGDRSELFARACRRFGELLGVDDAELVSAPDDLAADAYGLILNLHMAALAGVDAHARGDTVPPSAAALSGYFLRRERAHWQMLYERDPHGGVPANRMARAVYCATLLGPLSYDDALAVVDRGGLGLPAQSPMVLMDAHGEVYPSVDSRTVLEPLYPDRLGEDFLALQTPGHDTPGYRADPWADGAPARLLLAQRELSGNQALAAHAITRLIDVTLRWPHVGRLQLYPLLRDNPQLIAGIGGAALSQLAALDDIDMGVLESIATQLPEGRNVDLDVGAAAVTTRLVAHHLAAGTGPEKAAVLYRWLSFRLTNAGRYDDATAAAAQSAEIYRGLVAEDRAHEAEYAKALVNLTVALEACERWDEALQAAREAVGIRRRLSESDPGTHEADLAQAVSNLAALQFRRGEADEAIAVAQEVVRSYERLSADDPDEHANALAVANANLGMMLSESGRPDDAHNYTQPAVAIFRSLAQENRAAFSPHLANSLSNLAVQLSQLGRVQEGLAVADEAFHVYQHLVDVNPPAYEPGFARLLSNVSIDLREEGQYSDAFAVACAAAEIYQRLPSRSPDGFALVLAKSLSLLISDLSQQEERVDAATAAELAAMAYRRLTETDDRFTIQLATALAKMAAAQLLAGYLDSALAAILEALNLPTSFDPDEDPDGRKLRSIGDTVVDLLEKEERQQEATVLRRRLRGDS